MNLARELFLSPWCWLESEMRLVDGRLDLGPVESPHLDITLKLPPGLPGSRTIGRRPSFGLWPLRLESRAGWGMPWGEWHRRVAGQRPRRWRVVQNALRMLPPWSEVCVAGWELKWHEEDDEAELVIDAAEPVKCVRCSGIFADAPVGSLRWGAGVMVGHPLLEQLGVDAGALPLTDPSERDALACTEWAEDWDAVAHAMPVEEWINRRLYIEMCRDTCPRCSAVFACACDITRQTGESWSAAKRLPQILRIVRRSQGESHLKAPWWEERYGTGIAQEAVQCVGAFIARHRALCGDSGSGRAGRGAGQGRDALAPFAVAGEQPGRALRGEARQHDLQGDEAGSREGGGGAPVEPVITRQLRRLGAVGS